MRTTLALVLIAFGAFSCGDDGGGVAVDARYQVACPLDTSGPACGAASDPVDVLGFHDEDVEGVGTIRATCSAADAADGTKNLSFSLGYGNDPLMTVRGLVISPEGGPVLGSSCTVELRDNGNSYGGTTYGRCGNVAPTEDQPCQFSAFTFNDDGEFGPELVTTLVCRNLRAPAAPNDIVRDVTFPMQRNMPAQLKLINCENF
ncbi:MAG: hypothetical protein JJ863_06505 [Deltaproteobacteria bacterium]|nr:hypothetical protein [Deltaproteobacteria bacterium]